MTRTCVDCLTKLPPQAVEVVKVRGKDRVQCRSNLRCLNRAAAKLRAMIPIANAMSNVCYNLGQRSTLPEDDKRLLRDLVVRWDEEKRRS